MYWWVILLIAIGLLVGFTVSYLAWPDVKFWWRNRHQTKEWRRFMRGSAKL